MQIGRLPKVLCEKKPERVNHEMCRFSKVYLSLCGGGLCESNIFDVI